MTIFKKSNASEIIVNDEDATEQECEDPVVLRMQSNGHFYKIKKATSHHNHTAGHLIVHLVGLKIWFT